jgi:hypothetical protein
MILGGHVCAFGDTLGVWDRRDYIVLCTEQLFFGEVGIPFSGDVASLALNRLHRCVYILPSSLFGLYILRGRNTLTHVILIVYELNLVESELMVGVSIVPRKPV